MKRLNGLEAIVAVASIHATLTALAAAEPAWGPGVAPGPPAIAASFRDALRRALTPDDVRWLRHATIKQLNGCQVRAKGGIWVYTPDGRGHYRALWTRDFAYMMLYAGELIPAADALACIEYLLAGQRADGCIPDRVDPAGRPIYSPGPPNGPLADHALDNGPFMAILVSAYVEKTGDLDSFRRWQPALRRALDFVRRADNGLVYNPPDDPQCPYGFTDTVAKTGHLLFSSLLYYDACRRLARLCRAASCGDPDEYERRAALIRRNVRILWDKQAGMFWAADQHCKQIDIWGSALAVTVGCARRAQADRIASYLVRHYKGIIQHGHVRHLPPDEYWHRFLTPKPVRPGTYHNGAYWAVPVAWVAPVVARRDPALAARMVREAIAYFRRYGIYECINGRYRKLPNCVVSATNVYGLVRDLFKH